MANVSGNTLSAAMILPSAPSLTFIGPGGSTTLAATNDPSARLTGIAPPGAGISIFDGASKTASLTVAQDGTFSFTLGTLAPGAHSFAATVQTSVGSSALSFPVSVYELPAAVAGVSSLAASSLDIAGLAGTGYTLQLTAATTVIQLVDGTLSVGPDTSQAFIQRLYLGLLGRSADGPGLSAAALPLAAGAPLSSIAANILKSPEYVAQAGAQTGAQYVTSLYMNLLGRGPEPSGLAYWTGTLAAGTNRADVATLMALSPEAKTYNASNTGLLFSRDPTGTLLHELFETGLTREVDLPSLASFKAAANTGTTPAQFAQLVAGSAEFQAIHAPQSTTAFVTSLYQSALGRTPDAAGLQFWSGSTMTRASVLLGIATSTEASANLTRGG